MALRMAFRMALTNEYRRSAEEVPKSAEDVVPVKLEGQQLQIYNYVLVNKDITTTEAEKLLGVKERRARKILSFIC